MPHRPIARIRDRIATLLRGLAVLPLLAVVVLALTRSVSVETLSAVFLAATVIHLLSVILADTRSGVSFLVAFQLVLFIAVPAFYQVSIDRYPLFGTPTEESVRQAFALIAVAYLALYAAQDLGPVRLIRGVRRPKPKGPAAADFAWLSRLGWGVMALAVLCAALAGPGLLFAVRTDASDLVAASGNLSGQFVLVARSLSLVGMVMIVDLALNSDRAQDRRGNRIALALAIPCFLVINFPPALPRTYLLGPMIALSALFVDYRSATVKTALLVAATLLLFLVLPFLKILGSGGQISDIAQISGSVDPAVYLVSLDFDIFLWTAETLRHVDSLEDWRWGYNFLGVALFFVPRAIWAGKPGHSGDIVASAFGYPYTNVSSPIWAEGYIAFGILGTLAVMIAIGRMIGHVERASLRPRTTVDRIDLYLHLVLMAFVIIVFRGALNSIAPAVLPAVYVLLLARWWCGRR